jgi:hypothetical protein
MPRIQRRFGKILRTDLENLTEGQRQQLEEGKCFQFLAGFQDVDELRAAWEIHRADMLPEYIATHPGCRPFAWWIFDHGTERPIANHDDGELIFLENSRRERFGFAHTSIGLPVRGKSVPFQEPEHVYLRRHNLLTAAELEHPDLEAESL